jgi:hypothetical protein
VGNCQAGTSDTRWQSRQAFVYYLGARGFLYCSPKLTSLTGRGSGNFFPAFFFFPSMFLELNGDIFIEPIVDFMHRTKHLTKPGLGERLWGAAPNQDTKK